MKKLIGSKGFYKMVLAICIIASYGDGIPIF